jgi:hypothetical protein
VVILINERSLFKLDSPDGFYNVAAYQQRGMIMVERHVYLSVRSRETAFLEDEHIFSGDWLEGEFSDYFPEKRWISNNILKIGVENGHPPDSFEIKLLDGVKLKYLLVETYTDKFIVINPDNPSKINLDFEFDGILSVKVKTFNDETFGTAALIENYSSSAIRHEKPPQRKKLNFSITIKDKNVNIESPDIAVRRVACCGIRR